MCIYIGVFKGGAGNALDMGSTLKPWMKLRSVNPQNSGWVAALQAPLLNYFIDRRCIRDGFTSLDSLRTVETWVFFPDFNPSTAENSAAEGASQTVTMSVLSFGKFTYNLLLLSPGRFQLDLVVVVEVRSSLMSCEDRLFTYKIINLFLTFSVLTPLLHRRIMWR